MVSEPDPIQVALLVARLFERLGVTYCIGGSVASSVCGEVRMTLDDDVVVGLLPRHVEPFVAATRPDPKYDSRVRRTLSSTAPGPRPG